MSGAARTTDVAAGEARTRRIRRRLLAWYRASARDLPWRRTRDPYAIWISESMLQQTRVETVIPYYERFLARFPDVRSLARASLDDVLGLWSGLGYYSRARNLHQAAAAIVADHGGALPREAQALRTLPGIGRYTAGAIASIAFDRPAPIVDGNVARVLARLHGIDADVRSPDGQRRLWDEAGRLAAGPSPGALNQALMELGATLCTPRGPRCPACPVVETCRAHASGDPEALPKQARKAPPRPVQAVAAQLVRRGRWLAVQRPPEGLLGGLWELPGGELHAQEVPAQALARRLRERVGLEVRDAECLGAVEHLFTHLRLRLHVFRCGAPTGRVRLRGFQSHRWVSESGFDALAQGAATRKARALGAGEAP